MKVFRYDSLTEELIEREFLPDSQQLPGSYESFVNKNIDGFEIIKKYCEELTVFPYEEMLPTDKILGRWLEETISSLSSELLPMIGELHRFKIDTSVLDIYRNLLQLIGKRYTFLSHLPMEHPKEENRLCLPSTLTVSNFPSSPASKKRRHSRDHSEKNVFSILQCKLQDDRPPRFVIKIDSVEKPELSLSLWRKTTRIQKNKLKNYIDSIEVINKTTKKLCSRKASCSFLEWSKRINSAKKNTPQKSALEILNELYLEEAQEDIYDLGNRKGSLNCLSPIFKPKPSANKQSNFNKTVGEIPEIRDSSVSQERKDQPSTPNIEDQDKSAFQLEENEGFSFGSRRRLRSRVDDIDVQERQVSDYSLKFPTFRKDSKTTADSNFQGAFSRFSAGRESMSETTDNMEMGNRRSRRAVAIQECETMEVAESSYKMAFSMKVSPVLESTKKPEHSMKLERPIIKISIPEEEDDSIQQGPFGKPMNKRLQGVKNMLEEECSHLGLRRGSISRESIYKDERDKSLDRSFNKFDKYLAKAKRSNQKNSKNLNNLEDVIDKERLTMSDSEAYNRKLIRTKYENNHESIGIDDFQFISLLGKGGYGSVWLVKRKTTGDFYALKVIKFNNSDSNCIENLVNENKIMMTLVGDYVVKGIFSFLHDRFYCVVMDLMIGGDFRKLIEEQNAFFEEDAKFYVAELISAVSHIHQQGITHRDLKPENMLLDNKGHLKLADFGLSNKAEIFEAFEGASYNIVDFDVSIERRRKETRIYE